MNELYEEAEIYVRYEEAGNINVNELRRYTEYHPCEENRSNSIILGRYQYCIVLKDEEIEVCVTEDIMSKYWDHPFISAKLWFNSYVKAVENHEKCNKVYTDVDPSQLMSMLFFFNLKRDEYKTLGEIFEASEQILKELEKEATLNAKRSLIKYFNE